MNKKQESNRPEADPEFSNGGHMSRAEGESVEAPQAPRGWNLGRGVPSLGGLGRGTEFFFNCLPRNGAFFEHSDKIRQFTRPVAIRLKACKKRRRPYFPTKLGIRSFIRSKVSLWRGSRILNLGHVTLTTPTFRGQFVVHWLVRVHQIRSFYL